MSDSISHETKRKIIYSLALINDSREGFENIKTHGKLSAALTKSANMGIRDLREARKVLEKIIFKNPI